MAGIGVPTQHSSGHILSLGYAKRQPTDFLLVTHNYNPPGAPTEYHNQVVGVYGEGNNRNIYHQNTAIPMLNKSFNMLVVKQNILRHSRLLESFDAAKAKPCTHGIQTKIPGAIMHRGFIFS